jgi:hypothetical protein
MQSQGRVVDVQLHQLKCLDVLIFQSGVLLNLLRSSLLVCLA